jgi:hypothetical protein
VGSCSQRCASVVVWREKETDLDAGTHTVGVGKLILSKEMGSPPLDAPVVGDLVCRVLVSMAACALITWQFFATANFGPAAVRWRCIRLGGSPLQWYLVVLMALSVLEGVAAVIADVALLVSARSVQEEISIGLFFGKLSELIISLCIIGLGASGWVNGAKYARAATALGIASLTVRSLPAPLVLVLGVMALQGARRARRARERDGGCCTLSCALRPLLLLALLESMYASITINQEFAQRLEAAKHDPRILDSIVGDDQAAAADAMALLNALRPEQMVEMVQRQFGELVQLGVVVALGCSGRAHGLKHTLIPVATTFVPGLPTSFSVVLYFLLETRQAHEGNGGTLLPLHVGSSGASSGGEGRQFSKAEEDHRGALQQR